MTDLHSDFTTAPEALQWAGTDLAELLPLLSTAAAWHPGRWDPSACRVLPRGAWVQMRATEKVRYELRILRRPPPADDEGWKRFGKEVQVFRRKITPDLGRRWGDPFIETIKEGRWAAATMLLLLHNEAQPDRVFCAGPGDGSRCEAIIEWDPSFPANRCTTCATIAGSREARENFERRQGKEQVPAILDRREPYGGTT
jgi:hypothetical protein